MKTVLQFRLLLNRSLHFLIAEDRLERVRLFGQPGGWPIFVIQKLH